MFNGSFLGCLGFCWFLAVFSRVFCGFLVGFSRVCSMGVQWCFLGCLGFCWFLVFFCSKVFCEFLVGFFQGLFNGFYKMCWLLSVYFVFF